MTGRWLPTFFQLHNDRVPSIAFRIDSTSKCSTAMAHLDVHCSTSGSTQLPGPHLLRDDEAALLHAVRMPLNQRGRRRHLGGWRLDQPRLQQ